MPVYYQITDQSNFVSYAKLFYLPQLAFIQL